MCVYIYIYSLVKGGIGLSGLMSRYAAPQKLGSVFSCCRILGGSWVVISGIISRALG